MKTGISKTFPKLSFIITVKGGINMEFRIVDKPAFNLVGVSTRVPMQFEGVNNEIVKLAESITDEQKEEMHSLQNIEPYQIVNASYDADANFLKEEGDLTHLIGVLTTENQVSNLLQKVPVEAYTWAIFPNEGSFPSTLQETMAKIYSEWLPSSNYEVINAPAFSFTKMDEHKKDYAYSEVWIPVRKK
jgi:AraC family transcriptional regulator